MIWRENLEKHKATKPTLYDKGLFSKFAIEDEQDLLIFKNKQTNKQENGLDKRGSR